jgi:hypothetical protein
LDAEQSGKLLYMHERRQTSVEMKLQAYSRTLAGN